MPSWLSPQWPCGNLWTWVHDVQLHTAGKYELQAKQEA